MSRLGHRVYKNHVPHLAQNLSPRLFVLFTQEPQLELFPETNQNLLELLRLQISEYIDDELLSHALELREDDMEQALLYFYSPQDEFYNQTPLELLQQDQALETDAGRDMIMANLGRLAYGVFS